jgi:hypothetical protein
MTVSMNPQSCLQFGGITNVAAAAFGGGGNNHHWWSGRSLFLLLLRKSFPFIVRLLVCSRLQYSLAVAGATMVTYYFPRQRRLQRRQSRNYGRDGTRQGGTRDRQRTNKNPKSYLGRRPKTPSVERRHCRVVKKNTKKYSKRTTASSIPWTGQRY